MDKIASSEVTPEQTYVSRRSFLVAATAVAGALALRDNAAAQPAGSVLKTVPGPFSTSEPANSWEHATSYNNFYEFGTAK